MSQSESERMQSQLEPLELVRTAMTEAELKQKLALMDADIKAMAGQIEDAQLDLRHLVEKRRAFAMRNCSHPKEERYERSCMGREIDVYCGICDSAL
jgi:hypothetical protein